MSGELILEVRNRHAVEFSQTGIQKTAAAPLPAHAWSSLTGGPGAGFVSYFEGPDGDQWLCMEGPDTLYLTGGDVEWREYKVLAKEEMPGWQVPDLVLSLVEGLWLDACWRCWQARKERSSGEDERG